MEGELDRFYGAVAERTRRLYLDFCDAHARELASRLRAYHERANEKLRVVPTAELARSRTPVVFPLNVFVLAAADLGCREVEPVARLSFAALCANYHYLMLDDAVDRKFAAPDADRANDLILADLLLIRFLRELHESGLLEPGFWEGIEARCRRTGEAMYLEEERHVERITAYDDGALARIGEKSGPLILAVTAAIARLAGRDAAQLLLEEAIPRWCTALQLLDDLLDWEEDLSARRYTYPLTRALRAEGISEGDAGSPEAKLRVARNLVLTNTPHEIYELIDRLMAEARAVAGEALPLLTADFELRREHARRSRDELLRRQLELYVALRADSPSNRGERDVHGKAAAPGAGRG